MPLLIKKPKLILTIDTKGFNFLLIKLIKYRTLNSDWQPKIMHVVAPTVWAWRAGRSKKIQKLVDKLICLFPKEPEYFDDNGFILIDANSKDYIIGNPGKNPIKLKILNKNLHYKLLFHPDLYFGEAYTDGEIIIENGTLTDFLDLALMNFGRGELNFFSYLMNRLRGSYRYLTNFNFIKKSKMNVSHHYDISDELYDLFLDPKRQYSCAYWKDKTNSLEEVIEERNMEGMFDDDPDLDDLEVQQDLASNTETTETDTETGASPEDALTLPPGVVRGTITDPTTGAVQGLSETERSYKKSRFVPDETDTSPTAIELRDLRSRYIEQLATPEERNYWNPEVGPKPVESLSASALRKFFELKAANPDLVIGESLEDANRLSLIHI